MEPITKLQWASPARTSLIVTAGDTHFVPWPTGTWYGEIIQKAIDEGMQIEPPDALPTPIDFGDIDNLDKVIKAIGLTIAEVSGRTPLQIKTIFRQKYEAL